MEFMLLNNIFSYLHYSRTEPSCIISKPALVWMKSSTTTTPLAVLVSRRYENGVVAYCRFEMGLNGWRVGEGYEEDYSVRRSSRKCFSGLHCRETSVCRLNTSYFATITYNLISFVLLNPVSGISESGGCCDGTGESILARVDNFEISQTQFIY